MHHRIRLSLVQLLASVVLPITASAQWATVEIDTLAGAAASERSTRFSVAVDETESPHAVWSAGSSIFYSRKEAGTWIPPIELSDNKATYTVHAVAVVPGASEPRVLYSRTPFGAAAGELVLAEWNGSGFDVRDLTTDGVEKLGPALAVDATGAYHVVCVVRSSAEWRLRYLTNVTGLPTDVLLEAGPLGDFGGGASPAIAVEPDGIAHVVYRGVSGTYRIQHAENTAPGGAGWSWQTLISPNLNDLGSDVRIDAFGTVHVAVSGDDCSLCTRRVYVFERPSGGVWSAPVPIVHASGLGQPVLAVDGGGRAHVALSEISGNLVTGRIYYAGARTDWVPSLVIGDDHTTPSLAVDGRGILHLVCTTGPNTGDRDVLYLQALPMTVSVEEQTPSIPIAWSASPNPFWRQTVLRSAGRPNSGEGPSRGGGVIILDISGRVVRRLGPAMASGGGIEYLWDGRSDAGRVVPAGVYRVADVDESGRVSAGARAMTVVKLP